MSKEVEACGHHDDEKKRRRRMFIGILALIITIQVVIFLVWIILQPHKHGCQNHELTRKIVRFYESTHQTWLTQKKIVFG